MPILRPFLIAFFATAITAKASYARSLKIADVELGMQVVALPDLVRHGFVAEGVRPARLGTTRAGRSAWRRGDGHLLTLETAEDGAVVKISYDLGSDIDTHDRILDDVRSIHGKPKATHGSEDGPHLRIWEIPGTEMTAEGFLTTSIVLTDAVGSGDRLSIGQAWRKPYSGQRQARAVAPQTPPSPTTSAAQD